LPKEQRAHGAANVRCSAAATGHQGAGDGQDVASTEQFRDELLPRQPDVPLTLTKGCGHTMTTWRAEIPSLLAWMTRGPAQSDGSARGGQQVTPV
jgi:hypothetical protein